MTERETLKKYADQLILQKKFNQAIHNLLFSSFFIFSIGVIVALPFRYFWGVNHTLPILIASSVSILSFVYGFLGLESEETVFRKMDNILNLNEKMSAAWQFSHTPNPYSHLIYKDAQEIIEKVEPTSVFKIHFSKRDPFIPIIVSLFLYLWLSSFTFLQISDLQSAQGEMLVETSEKIDAVNTENPDTDLEELSEEYKKLGQKIQDRFMNQQSIENEVDELSRKLEEKIAELSREGVDKDSKSLGEEVPDSEVYQLERKREMNEDLQDILDSLMKTFSISPDTGMGGYREGENSQQGESGSSQGREREETFRSSTEEENGSSDESSEAVSGEESDDLLDGESSDDLQESFSEGNSSNEPGQSEGMEKEDAAGSEPSEEFDNSFNNEEKVDPNQVPGSDVPEDFTELEPFTEEKQSGEFDDDDNIRGDLREGEQMKSFIRALPHMVEPTREEMDVIRYYRNQLENSVDRELLPQGYETVIRDYFLGIGVLDNE